MQAWGWSIWLCIIIGAISGVFAARFTTEQMLGSRRYHSTGVRLPMSNRVASAVGALAVPFMWFFGLVVGGSLGGGYAEAIAKGVGLPSQLFIPFGIGIGIFIVTWLGVAAASCTAFLLARSVERIKL